MKNQSISIKPIFLSVLIVDVLIVAGTAGKGFAIVAEEVRNLSTRSNRFSEQIDKLLQEISTSLADVETSIEKLAARSDQLVKEEQENIACVMGQAQ
jgi:methyl-accepting chemotaxis protein